MTFTPGELRLLAAGDRGIDAKPNRFVEGRFRRRKPAQLRKDGGIGRLSYEEALRMHRQGHGRQSMAVAADCTTGAIGRWRQAHGLSRPKIR